MKSKQEQRLQEELFSLKITQFIVDKAPFAVFWLTADGGFSYVNDEACRSLGYKREELLKLKLWDIDPVFPKERWFREWDEFRRDSLGSQYVKTMHKRIDGTTFPVEIASRHIWFGENEIHVAFATDITERNKVEQILVESEHKLREANATKDKFFSIISHDLRNPFNTILGYSDLLTSNFDDYTEDEKRKIIAELNYSAKHTYSLLDNLLNWANTQLGRIEINKEVIDLKLLVRDSIDPYLSSASEKQIRVLNNIPEDININCDRATIGIVIGNIFNNSIKFTEKKGLITLNAESGKESVAIKITDTGVGMTKNVKDKLFKIDECKSLPGTESEQGTGLGLILCKEFIEKNGGSIEVESALGEGSTFTIKLPVE